MREHAPDPLAYLRTHSSSPSYAPARYNTYLYMNASELNYYQSTVFLDQLVRHILNWTVRTHRCKRNVDCPYNDQCKFYTINSVHRAINQSWTQRVWAGHLSSPLFVVDLNRAICPCSSNNLEVQPDLKLLQYEQCMATTFIATLYNNAISPPVTVGLALVFIVQCQVGDLKDILTSYFSRSYYMSGFLHYSTYT